VSSLPACVATGQPVPEDRFYQLDIDPPQTVADHARLDGTLRLEYIDADPLRSGRAVLFRDAGKPLQLQRYHYEFWVDQPPAMIYRALLEQLQSSGVAPQVLGSGQRGEAQYRMKARLQHFEEILGADTDLVEVELQVQLYDGASGNLLWSRTYLQKQPTGGNGMHATALAFQAALQAVFQDLLADVVATSAGS
jgi:ABC-type uncharacterized transport system auxiliary subunit